MLTILFPDVLHFLAEKHFPFRDRTSSGSEYKQYPRPDVMNKALCNNAVLIYITLIGEIYSRDLYHPIRVLSVREEKSLKLEFFMSSAPGGYATFS